MKDKSTLIIIVLLIAFALAGSFVIMYYFVYQTDECLQDPLVYGAKQLTDQVGYEFVATGFFRVPPNSNLRSPTITFNSTSREVKT